MTYIFETSSATFTGSESDVRKHIVKKFNAIEIGGSVCRATGDRFVSFWDGTFTSSGQKMWLTAGRLFKA